MSEEQRIKIFDDKQVRMEWNEDEQDWYISIVDVIELLTGTENPRRYWSDLKRKMKAEGSQLYEKIVQLKMTASDGRKRLADVADPELMIERALETYLKKGYSRNPRNATRAAGSVYIPNSITGAGLPFPHVSARYLP